MVAQSLVPLGVEVEVLLAQSCSRPAAVSCLLARPSMASRYTGSNQAMPKHCVAGTVFVFIFSFSSLSIIHYAACINFQCSSRGPVTGLFFCDCSSIISGDECLGLIQNGRRTPTSPTLQRLLIRDATQTLRSSILSLSLTSHYASVPGTNFSLPPALFMLWFL